MKTQAANAPPDMTALTPLLSAWVAFGLFTIGCSVLVALHSDRLSHRRKQAVLTNYFEHVLQLPISFHGGTHSGRLMKVMLTGVDALWGLWLSFFREHFAAFIALFVLLPLSLVVNWRLALILVILTSSSPHSPHWWSARPTSCRVPSRAITQCWPSAPPMR